MAFPTTSAQQADTTRKILEEIQTKKQLLAGGIINLGINTQVLDLFELIRICHLLK